MQLREKPTEIDWTGKAVNIGELLWSSDDTEWAGFPLAAYRLRDNARVIGAIQPCAQVAMCLAGHSDMQVTTAQGHQRSVSTEGALSLAAKNLGYDIFCWSGSSDMLFVDLDLTRISNTAVMQGAVEMSPEHRFLIRDTQISTILLNMVTEVKSGCPAGSTYGQCLSTALAAYICGRYAAIPPATPPRATLVPAQREKIRNYIHHHLADEISLQDLAQRAGLSASHFSMLFRSTFGCPPHKYVLRARIAEAQTLIAEHRLSIAEVAHATGFSDQSHLTKSFREATSMTPKQYWLSRSSA